MSEEPRALTADECRDRFIEHVWSLVRYCESETRHPDVREKLELLAFSILAAIDGAGNIPAFDLIPSPHVSDAEFHRSRGENWWPEGVDIAGALHELFHRVEVPPVSSPTAVIFKGTEERYAEYALVATEGVHLRIIDDTPNRPHLQKMSDKARSVIERLFRRAR